MAVAGSGIQDQQTMQSFLSAYQGIEKLCNIAMPLLFILGLIVMGR